MGELKVYPSVYRPSLVCPSSIFSNISYETIGLIEAIFYAEPPWGCGTKVCSGDLGHMTMMTKKVKVNLG